MFCGASLCGRASSDGESRGKGGRRKLQANTHRTRADNRCKKYFTIHALQTPRTRGTPLCVTPAASASGCHDAGKRVKQLCVLTDTRGYGERNLVSHTVAEALSREREDRETTISRGRLPSTGYIVCVSVPVAARSASVVFLYRRQTPTSVPGRQSEHGVKFTPARSANGNLFPAAGCNRSHDRYGQSAASQPQVISGGASRNCPQRFRICQPAPGLDSWRADLQVMRNDKYSRQCSLPAKQRAVCMHTKCSYTHNTPNC